MTGPPELPAIPMGRARPWVVLGFALIVVTLPTGAAATAEVVLKLPGLSGLEEVDHVSTDGLPPQLALESRMADGRQSPLRVAHPLPLGLSTADAGTWQKLPGQGSVWRLRVTSPGAVFLSFKFSGFELPVGAELRFHSVDHIYMDGPYTHRHNRPGRRFGTAMIPGQSVMLELFLPQGPRETTLTLESVSHGYLDIRGLGSLPRRDGTVVPRAGQQRMGDFSCQRDINCPEGDEYQQDKRAVAESYNGSWICSGTMLANSANDDRYLYLTAEHCESWRDAETMSYYWDYENSSCGADDAPFIFSTGSISLYHDPVADLDLLELDGTDLGATYDIYFSGWNRSTTPPTSAAAIGFPADKPKQIHIDDGPIVDCAPLGCSFGFGANFWRILSWEVGFTEPGASGSGLLDADHRVRGVLSGGVGSDCSDFEWDEFGKLSAGWTGLAPFLDPTGTGVSSLPGREFGAPTIAPPMADGLTGAPLRLDKNGDRIVVSFDDQTCMADRTAMLWGNIGDYGDYRGDVGPGCDLGSSGNGSFEFTGNDVWFNLVWINASDRAGHPGRSSSGPRGWAAAGLCGAVADDLSNDTCD